MVPTFVTGQWLGTAHIATTFEITIFGPSNPDPLQAHGSSGLELYVFVLVYKTDSLFHPTFVSGNGIQPPRSGNMILVRSASIASNQTSGTFILVFPRLVSPGISDSTLNHIQGALHNHTIALFFKKATPFS